jgi:hypothetical protein
VYSECIVIARRNRREKNKEYQMALKGQMEEHQRLKEEEKQVKVEDQEHMNQVLSEEQRRFKEYTDLCVTEW